MVDAWVCLLGLWSLAGVSGMHHGDRDPVSIDAGMHASSPDPFKHAHACEEARRQFWKQAWVAPRARATKVVLAASKETP